MAEDGSRERLAGYVEVRVRVIGHADRAGLLPRAAEPRERRSVEPIAAVTTPARVSAKHQSLLHFAANVPWSDEQILAKVRELVLPVIESIAVRSKRPDQSPTRAFRRKVAILSVWRASIVDSLANRTTARLRSACRWPITQRACRWPGACMCRRIGSPIPSVEQRPTSPSRSIFAPTRRLRWSRSGQPARPICHVVLF
jgi:hypothetical protein